MSHVGCSSRVHVPALIRLLKGHCGKSLAQFSMSHPRAIGCWIGVVGLPSGNWSTCAEVQQEMGTHAAGDKGKVVGPKFVELQQVSSIPEAGIGMRPNT